MIITFLRTFILYIIVLFTIRCMGKSGLSSTDPFQIVIMLMIAEIATIPIESPDTPMFNGIAAIAMILFLYAISGFISYKSETFKLLINGKPSVLIDNGAINFKELKKANITVTDLMEMLRLKDAPSISDVLYAYLETNGQFSIILKTDKSPVTREDMKINKNFECMPCILISDGTVYDSNLKKAGTTKGEITKMMKKISIKNIDDILLCFCDESAKIYFYEKSDNNYIMPKCAGKIKSPAS
ncbi:MAG: DUF421 domain-containing protein [Firmicutes bacterium]|nr:DUF421 domain-containing protein [Bacillota bacterium]